MARLILNPPPHRSAPFNTGDSLERGDSPKAVIDAINAMSTELYVPILAPQSLLNFRKKRNLLLSGAATSNVRLAIYGSSVDRGVDETALPYNTQYAHSVAWWLAALLKADGIPAGANNLFGVGGPSPTDLALRDLRFTKAGVPGTGTMSVPGGLTMTFVSGVSMTFTPIDSVNQFDVYPMDFHTAGITYTANIDGGANTNIATTGVDQYGAITSLTAGAVGAHTLNLAFGTGGWLAGIDAYDNTRKEVSIWNHACAGFTTAATISQNGTPAGGRLTFMSKYPVDAAGGTLGITNDWRLNLGPDASYANMQTFVQTQGTAGACPFLVTPPFDGGATGDVANQDKYVAKMFVVAQANNIPIIDWRSSAVSYAASLAAGLQGDATHLTTINGAVDMARAIKSLLFPR